MKSKLLLSAAMIIASLSASAQSAPILRAQVRAQFLSSGPVFYDSLVHIHSGSRNSIAAPSYLKAHYPTNGLYADDSTLVYQKSAGGIVVTERYYRTFNSAGMPTELLQDIPATMAGPAYTYKTLYSYNSAMLPDTTTVLYNSTIPAFRNTYAYNGGKLVESRLDSWDNATSSWEPTTVDSFYATGGAGSDSLYIYLNWNTNTLVEHTRHKYTRDAANRILRDSLVYMGSFKSVTLYEYDAQGRLVKDSVTAWIPSQSQALMVDAHYYSYDAQSNLIATRHRTYHNVLSYWYDVSIDSVTYNATHQVTSFVRYDATVTPMVPWETSYGQYFYYDNPVSVPEIAADNNLQLYPVPATTHINISIPFTKPQAFSVRIFDMQGRLVNKWQEQPQQTYNKQIPLTGIAPGQYTLQIFAGSESASRQFMVVR